MEFETLLKLIVGIAALVGIPLAGYAAFVATRAIWIRPGATDPDELARLRGAVQSLIARLDELEAQGQRVAELEERIDFAERMLVSGREAERNRAGTPPEPQPAVQ